MLRHEIDALFKPTIEDMGYVLWGCEYLAQGRHSLLRVYIDKKEGIGIADCERVSRQISALLDVEDPITGQYSLEVSSPGVPRPLLSPWHYEQYIGQMAQIKLYQPIEGKRKFEGRIVAVNDSTLVLDMDGKSQEFPFSNIVKANLTVE